MLPWWEIALLIILGIPTLIFLIRVGALGLIFEIIIAILTGGKGGGGSSGSSSGGGFGGGSSGGGGSSSDW